MDSEAAPSVVPSQRLDPTGDGRRKRGGKKLPPPGWEVVLHEAKSQTYKVFRGPSGEKLRSIARAWEIHEASLRK